MSSEPSTATADNSVKNSEKTEVTEAVECAVVSPGNRLREARELLGLTVEYVAERLHMAPAKVRFIENDEYERLPSPTFVQGYIRCYSKLVNLNESELAAMYDAYLSELKATTDQLAVEEEPVSTGLPWPKILFAVATVLIIALIALLLLGGEAESADAAIVAEPEIYAAQDVESTPVDEVIPVPPTAAETMGIQSPQGAGRVHDEASPEMDLVNPEAGSADSSLSEPSALIVSADEPATASELTGLRLVFSGECWVEITDAEGEALVNGLKSMGDQVTVSGKAPFTVVLGNARVTQLWLNNEAVALNPAGTRKLMRFSLSDNGILN